MNANVVSVRRSFALHAASMLLTGLICGTAANGAIITFREGVSGYTGTQDTFVDGTGPSNLQITPQGANTTLFVYDREHFNDPNDLRITRTLIRFDLSSLQANLTAGDTITNVTLTLTSQAYAFGTKGVANSLHRIDPVNAAWTESQATWQNRDQSGPTPWAGGNGLVSGTDYIATALDVQNSPNPGNLGPSDGDTITFTLNDLSFLPGWINNPSTNAGFLIRQPGVNTGAYDRFYSSEASNVAFRPLLTVTLVSVPEPASSVTMLMGAAVFALARWRRRGFFQVAAN